MAWFNARSERSGIMEELETLSALPCNSRTAFDVKADVQQPCWKKRLTLSFTIVRLSNLFRLFQNLPWRSCVPREMVQKIWCLLKPCQWRQQRLNFLWRASLDWWRCASFATQSWRLIWLRLGHTPGRVHQSASAGFSGCGDVQLHVSRFGAGNTRPNEYGRRCILCTGRNGCVKQRGVRPNWQAWVSAVFGC